MHPNIPGYRLTQELHRSPRTLVFRAVREADGRSVVVKTIPKAYPEPQDLARLRREHRLLEGLAMPGAIRPLALVAWENNVALVLEDGGAQTLEAALSPGVGMPLDAFFRVAIALTRVLSQLHQQLIHQDVNPRNVLWDPATEALKLIDFGLATELGRDRAAANAPRRLVGTLPYLSPEQTGRMNREVDARSDLYSLGVTFYQLLTGQLPFLAADPMEWVYCHITQVPAPPERVAPAVPQAIGAVVMKLLAKNPEDRYQSAQGLMRDLAECRRRWAASGEIAPFELAKDDVKAQFRVPQRLYGRREELAQVMTAYASAAKGRAALAVVTGPSGIGKSALVGEVRRSVEERGGWFFEGKFDQFQRQRPYAAVSQALAGLTRRVLAAPEAQLERWRARLAEALGPNARLAVDLVPELARVTGPTQPVAPLAPTEEQNRFLATIAALIAVFARPEHPLVLFLDDLQWGDQPTMTLVKTLLEGAAGRSLLVVGAYRDDEVAEGHPLLVALADLDRSERVTRLTLGPLEEETLNRIVADTLQTPPDRTRDLSTVIARKSAGNPFFAGELLRTLHQDGLFTFDQASGRWRWELEGIGRAQISDNVVAFVLERLQRFAPETQSQLRLAACIGDAFDLRLLAELTGQSPATVTAELWPAIAAGLVAPLDEAHLLLHGSDSQALPAVRCQFLHDRVRQAAYALMPEAERRETHLRIGRSLLARAGSERDERASEIVQQLNEGRALMTDAAERRTLAELNRVAASAAKSAAAYRTAYDYARVARELLPSDAWKTDYDLAFSVAALHASAAYLCGETAEADAAYAELLAHAKSALEKAEVHAMRAAQYTFGGRMDDAITEGIRALALLGLTLDARPSMATMLKQLALARWHQGRRRVEDLERAELATDPAIRLAMKILGGFLVPAYLSGQQTLFGTSVLMQVNLSLQHGLCDESVSAYSGYAVLLAGLGDLKGAYAFGALALRLGERFDAVESRCRSLILYTLFAHSWSQPWGTLEAWFKETLETGLRTGDFLFMAYACGYVHLWDPQIDLKRAVEEGRKYLALTRQTTYANALDANRIAHQFLLNMRGETDGPLSLGDEGFDEAACLARMERAQYVSGIAIYGLNKLMIACVREAWDDAWRWLGSLDATIASLAGSPYMVEHCVYGFKAAVAIAHRGGPEARAAARRAKACHRKMRQWADHCPDNFRHHARLMEAELARLAGRHAAAPGLFEAAIAAARQAGHVRFEAQANEAAARHFKALGLDRVAAAYWRDARDGYVRWGATAKVRALEARLPDFRRQGALGSDSGLDWDPLEGVDLGRVPQLVESGLLDLTTVWKATQAISGEPTRERLFEKLMAIVKESAGAQRGVLVLHESDDEGAHGLFVQAESGEGGATRLLGGEPLEDHGALPVSLIRYVLRTQTSVVLDRAASEGAFTKDPYIASRRPLSVLAMPIVNQGQALGVLYLENNVLSDAFTPERLAVLQILAGQAAVSLQNVRVAERAAYLEAERMIKDTYARELEARVDERTAELTQAYGQLMELDRLKTNFLNVVSHELRTPLTAIQGYAEFLEDRTGGELTEDQEDFVRQIQHGTLKLKRLVDDLLDFARVEAGAFSLVLAHADMSQAIADALESLQPLFRERELTIEASLPAEPVWTQADAGRVAQVVLNLVGNAVKFTPRGGTIRVSLGVTGGELRVEVRDSGIGIAPQHLPKLFQKFFQVDSSSTREKGGVGLGLSIAQSIVEAHGGQIGVESAPGEGSTFWFTLPHAAEPNPEAPAASPETSSAH